MKRIAASLFAFGLALAGAGGAQAAGTGWTVSRLPMALSGSGYPQVTIAADRVGNLHVAATESTADMTGEVIRYLRRAPGAAAWESETVAAVPGTRPVAIALGPDGRPHVVFGENTQAMFYGVRSDDGTWRTEALAGYGAAVDIAVDATGAPCVLYVRGVVGGTEIRFTRFDGSAWQDESVAIESQLASPHLVVDAAGTPHVTYVRTYTGVCYATRIGGLWQVTQINADNVSIATITLDPAGRPNIYSGGPNSFARNRWAVLTGAGWNLNDLSFGSYGVGSQRLLRIDDLGQPHFAIDAHGSVGYVTLQNGTWTSAAMGQGEYSITIDLGAHDWPRIVFVKLPGSTDGEAGYYLAEYMVDGDGDGSDVYQDCDDADPGRYPGLTEVRFDGVDQDCNGHDLTTDVLSATWSQKSQTLVVKATSALGASAGLKVELASGSLPMKWDARRSVWTLTQKSVPANPGSLTVSGVEGALESGVTTVK